jgi:hypothetical protein
VSIFYYYSTVSLLSAAICNLCYTIHILLKTRLLFTIYVTVSGYYFGWAIIRTIYAISPSHFVTWIIPVLILALCPTPPKHMQIFASAYTENILDLATAIPSNKSRVRTISPKHGSIQSSPNYTGGHLMEKNLTLWNLNYAVSPGQMCSLQCRDRLAIWNAGILPWRFGMNVH